MRHRADALPIGTKMPIKHKTRHDPPMKKKAAGPKIFHGPDSGEKPHSGALSEALKVSPKARIGGKTTLTR